MNTKVYLGLFGVLLGVTLLAGWWQSNRYAAVSTTSAARSIDPSSMQHKTAGSEAVVEELASAQGKASLEYSADKSTAPQVTTTMRRQRVRAVSHAKQESSIRGDRSLFERFNVFKDQELKQALNVITDDDIAGLPILLQQLKPGDELERDRIIVLATKIDSEALLPLWADLLERKTPRYANESKLLSASHPGLESRLISVERLQAIRKLGQLSFRNTEAKSLLLDAALDLFDPPLSELQREQAVVVLSESDPRSLLATLSKLDADDPLRARLRHRLLGGQDK